MKRLLSVTLPAMTIAVSLLAAEPKFTSVWKSPDAGSTSFAGKKVAALVITNDESLRVAGEEALARELGARGLSSVPTYRIAPKEELQSGDRARIWFEKASVEGVVAMRPVSKAQRTTYDAGIWASPYYSTLWGYYGYGWNNIYIPGPVNRDTIVVVETTIYSVPKNQLLWAGVSETKNPSALQRVIEDLVKASVKQLHTQGFARSIAK